MEVPTPLTLPRLKLAEAKKGTQVIVTHFYADSYPGKRGEIVRDAFTINGKERVKVCTGQNRAGKKFIKQFPLNVLALA